MAEPRYRRLFLALPRAVVKVAGGRGCGPNPRGRDRNFPPPAGLAAGNPGRLQPARSLPRILALVLSFVAALAAALSAVPALAASPPGAASPRPGLYETFRWLRLAERLAHAEVTHQICGWGFLDLRTPLAGAVFAAERINTAYPEILQRFDDTLQERQRQEAQLAAAAPPPPQRLTGLHATAGCPESLRQQIQDLPEGLNRFLEKLW